MKRALSTALIFVAVFSTLAASTIQSSRSETENACMHRIKIIVDNSGNPETLTNYQVFLNVTHDSHMQADFDDLRFTWYDETSGEEVDIDYWLDKYVDSEYALVWVEVPEIRGAGQEVLYMYYGDPEAVSESNGEETFVFFDGFSTNTTSNYELWSPLFPLPSGNPYNEFSWDPNGWLFVNASVRESSGRNSNVHVTHKTAQIDATEEKYWLETRGKAFGTGILDYFGVGKAYKCGSVPDDNCELFCLVRPNPQIQSLWGDEWEFRESGSVPTGKDKWYRFGVGTSPNGTVIGRFYDDDCNEIETIVNQTIHQDNEWWVDLLVSRGGTDTWATMHAWFDYVRVRKFTDPPPSCYILPSATVVFFNINPNPTSPGQTITLKGVLIDECTSRLGDETVRLYAKRLGTPSWVYITSLTTDSCGIFTWQVTVPWMTPAGIYLLAVYYPGSETCESCYNFDVLVIQ